jgi:hypothetical protein
MFTLAAYYKSVDPDGSFVPLNAVPDAHLTVSGTDVLVPSLSKLLWAAGVVDFTSAPQARISAPSLLEQGFPEYIGSLNNRGALTIDRLIHWRGDNPIDLMPVEALQFHVLSDPSAASGHYGIICLGDGPVTPVKGAVRTIRATAAITLVSGVWANGALTFPVSLKAGKYQIVGMRVNGANLIAARLVIPGASHRPGVLGNYDAKQPDIPQFRNGEMGVWGEFMHSSPPTLDVLGVTDTAQEVFLDVIYTG